MTSRYGVKVEFIVAESYLHMGKICEEVLQTKDLSIIATGLSNEFHQDHETLLTNYHQ